MVKKMSTRAPSPSRSDKKFDEDAFCDDRFNSQKELDCWTEHWITRKAIPEREFLIDTFSEEVQEVADDIIGGRWWTQFNQDPGEYNLTLVREFYAIVSQQEAKHNHVTIRGVLVGYSKNVINTFYGLRDKEPSYRQIGYEKKDPVYAERARLFLFSHIPKPTHFPCQMKSLNLTMPYKFWHRFINFRLLPSTNTSELPQERFSLIYRVASDEGFNVGEYIFQQIKKLAATKTSARGTRKLGFPCLITELCRRAGVPWSHRDERHTPKPFTADLIKNESEAEPSNDGDDDPPFEMPPQPTDIPRPSEPPPQVVDSGLPDDAWSRATRFHYAMASAQMDHLFHNNQLRASMDRHFGVETPPFQFNCHGYPFEGFYSQYPECFSTTSTNFIPPFAQPFFGGRSHAAGPSQPIPMPANGFPHTTNFSGLAPPVGDDVHIKDEDSGGGPL